MLKAGDIFCVDGGFPFGTLSELIFAPKNKKYHHGLIKQRVFDDYEIIESTMKGINVALLSAYKGKNIKFYRVQCDDKMREVAPLHLLKYGYCGYDFPLFAKLLIAVIRIFIHNLKTEFTIRRIRAEEIPYTDDNLFACVEAVDKAYDDAGFELIPKGVVPLPSAFKQAEIDGRMVEIDAEGNSIAAE